MSCDFNMPSIQILQYQGALYQSFAGLDIRCYSFTCSGIRDTISDQA